ncbi:DUF3105 domain-containing protein [Lysinibacter sp. HNR]|uniref:DUF3105 domain-containing protein n=1 Tax=Lysinibacter sp. HNR TaxID=3031408 RepID=UPI00243492DD|nr:DUF3105 domain-containing protein [Lysinibacter sp. HNR]WGD36578.1 DUF3105 domain-containing protein [Lysinibacter sp. HNR]
MTKNKGQSTKQLREERRQEKLTEFRKQQARSKRNKKIGVGVGITAGVLVAGLIVGVIATSLNAPTRDEIAIEGVDTYANLTNNHVTGTVNYEQDPPVGGDHNQYWLNCGAYTEEVPTENAVHSLEHGAVWVTYNRDLLSEDEVRELRSKLPSSYVILSPRSDLPSPIVMSAWGAQLQLEEASDSRIQPFLDKFWRSPAAPEPGASCTGAIDGPGKDS